MNKRRVLSLILAILMVMTLLPTSALAASKGKTANVQASVKIGGKTVKVALEKAPAGTKLKLSEPKKSDYKKAVDKAVSGKYDVVLAVKAGVSPSLKKEVKATITASAVNGKKADELRLFRVSNGKAKEIKIGSASGKELTFNAKSFGILVLVKVAPPAPTPTAAPQPTDPPADPTDPPADPTDPPANPTDPPADPTEPPVDPTEPPVDPTEPPVDPTEPPVDPTEPPVDPTEPPVDPTEPPVDPTEPPVDPTEPPVDPTEPPVDPTEPPVDPTEPPVDPTEPPVDRRTVPPAPIAETLGEGEDAVTVTVTGAPEGTTLTLAAANTAADAAALDLVLTDGYETKLALDIAMEPDEFDEPVTVSVSAPALAGLSAEGLELYHIKNGAAEKIDFTLVDGVLTFASKSFSDFDLLAPNAPADPPAEEPTREPERQTFTLTVQLDNRLEGNMWVGEGITDIHGVAQDTFPTTATISFSLADQETISCSLASAATTLFGLCQDEVEGPMAYRSFMIFNGSQLQPLNEETAFMNDGGKLRFKQGTSGAKWVDWTETNAVTLRFFPKYMLVKVDPNTSDVAVVGSQVEGKVTINGRQYDGVQFIRFMQTGAITSNDSAPYKIADAADKPTEATFMDMSTTTFTKLDYGKKGNFSFSTYKFTDAMNIYYGTYTQDDHYVYNVPRKPGLTATYSLPSPNTSNVAPIYPNKDLPGTDENGYPRLENGDTQGFVTAHKTAQWANMDMSVAKILLSVQGVPIYKGSDVVIVLDRSGSMGGRYRLDHPDLESYAKKATLEAVDILLSKSLYNNRVAIVNFSQNDTTTGVGMGFRTTNERQDMVNYMLKWTVHNGSTATYRGMNEAYQLLQSRSTEEKANRKGIILFLTDGIPNPDSPYPSGQRPTTAFLDSIGSIYELYTIGIKLPPGQPRQDLASWARPQDNNHSYIKDNPEDLIGVFQEIALRIVNAGENAVFADDISIKFDSWTNANELAEFLDTSGTTYTGNAGAAYLEANYPNVIYNGKAGVTITDSGEPDQAADNISISVGSILPNVKLYEIYMKIDPVYYNPFAVEPQKTNDEVFLTYTDPNGNTVTLDKDTLGDPSLGRDRTTMQIMYYRVNSQGQYLAADGRVVSESQKSAARVSTVDVSNLHLETSSSEVYTIYCDGPVPSGTENPDNHGHRIWGTMPAGYVLWDDPSNPASKTQTITSVYTVTYTEEFKVIAPYTITKARNDDDAHKDSSNSYNCTGYAKDERVPFFLTITNTSNVEMTDVWVVDTAVVPKGGYDNPAAGEFTYVSAFLNGTDITSSVQASYNAATHTLNFTIPSIPGQGVVVISYTYKVPGSEIGSRIDNWASVMGIRSDTIHTPTRILVEKVWQDDLPTFRPQEGVTVKLLLNGEENKTVVLTANGSWKGGFMVDDSAAVYTVTEDPVPAGYTLAGVTGTPADGFVVTNRAEPFYIYHSLTGKLEAVSMTKCDPATGKYNLFTKVSQGGRYGGYYSACGAVTAENIETAKAAASKATPDGDGIRSVPVTDAVVYSGNAVKNGSTRFWTKANAANPKHSDTAYTEIGTAMTPVPGNVYYLKEVPVKYLLTLTRYVYNWTDNTLQFLYFLTDVDDTFYGSVYVDVATDHGTYPCRLASSFSYTQRNTTNIVVAVTTKDFDAAAIRGYVGTADASDLLAPKRAAGKLTITPGWTTLDGVDVPGDGYSITLGDGTTDPTTGIHKLS